MDEQALAANQSKKDPKKFITPFAFSVSPNLYGVALASPLKRVLAILIDLFVIVLLAELSSTLLAILIAIVFWQISRQFALADEKPVLKVCLRVFASLILFGLLAFYYAQSGLLEEEQSLNWSVGDESSPTEDASLAQGAAYAITAFQQNRLIAEKKESLIDKPCEPAAACWQSTFNGMAQQLVDIKAPKGVAEDIMAAAFEESELSAEAIAEIRSKFPKAYLQLIAAVPSDIQETAKITESDSTAAQDSTEKEELSSAAQAATESAEEENDGQHEDTGASQAEPKNKYSIVAYINALLADLGLGFGWAAFYFTVMSAWFTGQTVGKYLIGIKVIKLNGEKMSLWESFGRYGGYGAGLATGLMGFIQIYWDPNRQAIQDKISETLVVDLRKSRYDFLHESIT
ncbi:RDD family protein [uncultured Pseudoteredinibacter sp.]|uniref:RDD family protein n=1 Tax=uncultured Pseudoteredinibacter sp. TaxID=1641701 RepID=UPI002610B108|nr:RDD family protein [uncultured Pseudoteredinibacter sp.]